MDGEPQIDGTPSSRITLSPNILTSTTPRVLSTILVRISRIDFERALTSIAHTPRVMGLVAGPPAMADKFESEPEGEGERDLFVKAELDLADLRSGVLMKADITRVGRSRWLSIASARHADGGRKE